VAYAAAGRTPFDADSAPATAMRILTQLPDLTGLPASLRGPVERALAKEPDDRPTARELLDMLVAAEFPQPGRAVRGHAPVPPPPDPAGVPAGPRPARPRRLGRFGSVAVFTLVAAVLAGVAVLVVHQRFAQSALEATTTPSAGRSASAPTLAAPTPTDTHAAILRGQRRTLIHVAEIDRDLALDLHSAEVTAAADGTGAKSLFLLVPYGVDYLIRTLRDGSGTEASGTEEECLGVKIVPDAVASLAPAQCTPTRATIFSLAPTGKKDDKGRPTYRIANEAFGFVQYSPTTKAIFVEEVGDAEPLSSFSLVDRGPR
jgi:hypothetical protein